MSTSESREVSGGFEDIWSFRGLRSLLELSFGMMSIIIGWEAIVFITKIKEVILPAPSDIFLEIVTNSGYFVAQSSQTLTAIITGFIAGILFGLVSAVGIYYVPFLRRGLYPILAGFNQVPKIAFAPLLLVWFGAGLTSNTIIAMFIVFFPMLVNTFVGLGDVDKEMIEIANLYQVSELFILRKIRFPSALPLIMAALKLGSTLAVIGAVVGEFVASSEGLGFVLVSASSQLRTTEAYASVVLITLIALVLYLVVLVVERWALYWYES